MVAVWETWTATSAVKTAKVTVGGATRFTIAANTTTPAPSGSVNLTITARDQSGSAVTTYTGSHSLVFAGASASPSGTKPTVANSSGTAVAFGTATALNFTAGVASVSSSRNGLMKLYRSGPTEVSASEGDLTTPAPLLLTVGTGSASKLVLAATTTAPSAGAPNELTVTAQDTYGNAVTSYAGTKSLTFSGASASPGGNVPTVSGSGGSEVAFGTPTPLDFEAGVAGGTLALYKSGTTSVKATDGSVTTPSALALTVAAATASKLVLTGSTAIPVSTGSLNLTTTAQDPYANTATAYAGSKSITFSGAGASPSGALPTVVSSAGTATAFGTPTELNFKAGVAAVASSKNGLTRLPLAGATSVSASDGTISTATPLALTVSVGTATRLAITAATPSAGILGSPCLFTCAITGLGNGGTVTATVSVTDNSGNTVSGLTGTHGAKVTANGGSVSGGTLTIATGGSAVSTTAFTYTAPASGSFTNTITMAKSGGTSYTSATATATR